MIRYDQLMESSPLAADCIDFVGDAQLLLTAPFYPDTDPLGHSTRYGVPAGQSLDEAGRIVRFDRPIDRFVRGSLTYGNPPFDLLTHFSGSERFNAQLAATARQAVDLPLRLMVTGILCPDGYGSVAVRMTVVSGWDSERRERLIDQFGPKGRDLVAEKLRALLLPALNDVLDHCGPAARGEVLLPYFNLTYTAETTHERPGRAVLPDELRPLVYPRSPAPITSDSPWSDEFFYAGYAFSLLASATPQGTLDQLEHLLLHLNILHARLDRSAEAADLLVRESSPKEDIDRLIGLERRLRADYQALVRPTFSYNYHVLKLRDSLLHAWDADAARERAETLLQMARQSVERSLAEEQARRVARVNLVVTILTIFSFVASVDAVVDLWERFF
jgi:hypothetical protein